MAPNILSRLLDGDQPNGHVPPPTQIARRRASVTAAGKRLPIDQPQVREKLRKRSNRWQSDAWECYDAIPEIKFTMIYVGNLMSRIRLYPAYELEDDEPPVALDSDQLPSEVSSLYDVCRDELARLRSSEAGLPGILSELAQNWCVPGECYLVGLAETGDEPETWDIKSTDELKVIDEDVCIVTGPEDKQGRVISEAAGDYVTRLWQRHPRWSQQADSNLRAVLDVAEELQLLSQESRARSRSRMSAGILLVPKELSDGPPDPTQDQGDQEGTTDPFDEDLANSIVSPIADEGDERAAVPLVVRGEAEYLKPDVFRWLTFHRNDDGGLDNRRETLVKRVARGLPLPLEVVMGHQETTFANAAAVQVDVYKAHLEPLVLMLMHSLTTGWYRPFLVAAGVDPELVSRIVIVGDPAEIVRPPDQSEDAHKAYENDELSGEAYIRALNFNPATDRPSPEEQLQRMGLKRGITDAALTEALLKLVDPTLEVPRAAEDPGKPVPTEPPPEPAPAEGASLEDVEDFGVKERREHHRAQNRRDPISILLGAGEPSTPSLSRMGRRLTELDRDLRTRVLVLLAQSMDRALEKAGARVRNRVKGTEREVVAAVPNAALLAALGRARVAAIGYVERELLEDAFAETLATFDRWVKDAQADVRDLVAGALDSQREADAYVEEQDASRERAVAWLGEALMELAEQALYNPDPRVPEVGENDPHARVQAGVVRTALALAGGWIPDEPKPKAQAATVTAALELLERGIAVAIGGVGTGLTVDDILDDSGAQSVMYVWDYGPGRRRPFEPHLRLDGQEFESFDDSVLLNTTGWPETAYFIPGDHDGCQCDFEMQLAECAIGAAAGGRSCSGGPTKADLVEQLRADGYEGPVSMRRDELLAVLEGRGGGATVADEVAVWEARPVTVIDDPRFMLENFDDWRGSSDPRVRATGVWQQNYHTMRGVRQIEENIRLGRDAFAEARALPNDPAFQYRVQKALDTTTGQYVDVLTDGQVRDEMYESARQLRSMLDDAQPTSSSLWRGMRVDDIAEFAAGSEFDVGVTSFTESLDEATLYTKADEFRPGGYTVLVELQEGARTVSLSEYASGPMKSSKEHILQGKLRVVSRERDANGVVRVVMQHV